MFQWNKPHSSKLEILDFPDFDFVCGASCWCDAEERTDEVIKEKNTTRESHGSPAPLDLTLLDHLVWSTPPWKRMVITFLLLEKTL